MKWKAQRRDILVHWWPKFEEEEEEEEAENNIELSDLIRNGLAKISTMSLAVCQSLSAALPPT